MIVRILLLWPFPILSSLLLKNSIVSRFFLSFSFMTYNWVLWTKTMGRQWSLFSAMDTLLLCILLSSEVVLTSYQNVGKVYPGIEGSQMNWIDRYGILLESYNGEFGFGLVTTANDSTLFLLAIVHMHTPKLVWVANRELPVSNSDKFVFDEKGNVILHKGESVEIKWNYSHYVLL